MKRQCVRLLCAILLSRCRLLQLIVDGSFRSHSVKLSVCRAGSQECEGNLGTTALVVFSCVVCTDTRIVDVRKTTLQHTHRTEIAPGVSVMYVGPPALGGGLTHGHWLTSVNRLSKERTRNNALLFRNLLMLFSSTETPDAFVAWRTPAGLMRLCATARVEQRCGEYFRPSKPDQRN